MFFSWATPLVDVIKNNYILTSLYQYARHSKLNIAQMGDLKNEDKVEYALQKVEGKLEKLKGKRYRESEKWSIQSGDSCL